MSLNLLPVPVIGRTRNLSYLPEAHTGDSEDPEPCKVTGQNSDGSYPTGVACWETSVRFLHSAGMTPDVLQCGLPPLSGSGHNPAPIYPFISLSSPRLCSKLTMYSSILGSSFVYNNAIYGGAIYIKTSHEQCINPEDCFTVGQG